MRLAFVLHLYQPITQEKDVFNAIYQSCYSPLLKLIKNKRISITLNTPLSLLEQMEKYQHTEWIETLKELVQSEKVEITGSAAYHPLLTRLPERFIEEQVILNEYGLGYYLGRRTGFEGEPSILVQNLNGFFPPELAVNTKVIDTIAGLGYKWILTDETVFGIDYLKASDREKPGVNGFFNIKDKEISLVIRDKSLSNALAFKRDSEINDLKEGLWGNKVVALDAETFGHHNEEGILLLENLVDYINEIGGQVTKVSDILEEIEPSETEEGAIKESTWGAGEEDLAEGQIYPIWDIKGNKIQKELWELYSKVVKSFENVKYNSTVENGENIPVWKEQPSEDVKMQVLFLQSLNSDQFWWASEKQMPDGKVLFARGMITNALNLYKQVSGLKSDSGLSEFVEDKIKKIENLLDTRM